MKISNEYQELMVNRYILINKGFQYSDFVISVHYEIPVLVIEKRSITCCEFKRKIIDLFLEAQVEIYVFLCIKYVF